jgi:hypothetical protein
MDFNSLPVTEFTSAGLLVWIIQQLKKLPWAEMLPSWAYRVISIVWAIVSTLIVGRLTLPQTAFPGHSQAAEAGIDVWFMASQFIIQEVVYRMTGKGSTTAPTTAEKAMSQYEQMQRATPAAQPAQGAAAATTPSGKR